MTSVTVFVYLPLLSLSLGYAQVEGLWEETGRMTPRSWKRSQPPRTAWRGLPKPPPRDWKTERP
jgi:hypothetical protein